jgi:hypothetical protein
VTTFVPEEGLSRTLAAGRFLFPLEASHVYSRLRMHELHADFPEADAGQGLRASSKPSRLPRWPRCSSS